MKGTQTGLSRPCYQKICWCFTRLCWPELVSNFKTVKKKHAGVWKIKFYFYGHSKCSEYGRFRVSKVFAQIAMVHVWFSLIVSCCPCVGADWTISWLVLCSLLRTCKASFVPFCGLGWEPVDHLQGSLGSGPERSLYYICKVWKKSPGASGPGTHWESGQSLEKVFRDLFETFSRLSRLFRDFFQTLGGPGPEVSGVFFSDFFGVSGPVGPTDLCKWSMGSQAWVRCRASVFFFCEAFLWLAKKVSRSSGNWEGGVSQVGPHRRNVSGFFSGRENTQN